MVAPASAECKGESLAWLDQYWAGSVVRSFSAASCAATELICQYVSTSVQGQLCLLTAPGTPKKPLAILSQPEAERCLNYPVNMSSLDTKAFGTHYYTSYTSETRYAATQTKYGNA